MTHLKEKILTHRGDILDVQLWWHLSTSAAVWSGNKSQDLNNGLDFINDFHPPPSPEISNPFILICRIGLLAGRQFKKTSNCDTSATILLPITR